MCLDYSDYFQGFCFCFLFFCFVFVCLFVCVLFCFVLFCFLLNNKQDKNVHVEQGFSINKLQKTPCQGSIMNNDLSDWKTFLTIIFIHSVLVVHHCWHCDTIYSACFYSTLGMHTVYHTNAQGHKIEMCKQSCQCEGKEPNLALGKLCLCLSSRQKCPCISTETEVVRYPSLSTLTFINSKIFLLIRAFIFLNLSFSTHNRI